jgi:hypothetical protein
MKRTFTDLAKYGTMSRVMYMFTVTRTEAVKLWVESERPYFYGRLAAARADRLVSCACKNMICGVIEAAYDFFTGVRGAGNIFYKYSRQIDSQLGRALYKWSGVYDTVKFLSAGSGGASVRESARAGADVEYVLLKKKAMEQTVFEVFNLSEDERDTYRLLYTRYNEAEAEFEVAFSKLAAAELFGGLDNSVLRSLNPAELAFVSCFFDSAYKNFTAAIMREQGIEVPQGA